MKKVIVLLTMLICCTAILAACGHTHKWQAATCTEPKTCKTCGETEGKKLGHDWEEATCTEPKTCAECGETKGKALGHDWVDATCEAPKTCKECGQTKGEKGSHSYTEETNERAATCIYCGEMIPSELPKNGQVFVGADLKREGELTINSNQSEENHYVKMKDALGRTVFAFFVRGGTTVTMNVPTGSYYVYFAHGEDWYGTEFAFGKNGSYSKDYELLDFKTYTWSYTMYPVTNGNFSETPIDPEDF